MSKLEEVSKKLETIDTSIPEKTDRLFSISETRRELKIPLVIMRRLLIWGTIKGVKVADGTYEISSAEVEKARKLLSNPWTKFRLFFKALGPGLITGASDDDPSGIATYSSVGARYGFGLLWMAVWILPMMLAVQETCARIGIVTNKGLAGVMTKKYKKGWIGVAVFLLIFANVINIGADLGAMAASLQLLVKIEFINAAMFFALLIIAVQVFVPYKTYFQILKWLTLAVFAYIITGIIIKPDWGAIWIDALIPQVNISKDYLFAMVAILGTTITPYLFFWQASEEVEEHREEVREPNLKPTPKVPRIRRMRTDVATGMILANLVFFFIILTCASVLFQNGIHSIDSAEQAALALRPFAGEYAYLLFAIGIIGTGLLAIPILAGSGAYALSQLMNWKEGFGQGRKRAKYFYAVMAFSVLFGLIFNLFNIDPIKALYYSAFINGIIAVPLIYIIMKVGDDKNIMGREIHPGWVRFFGWLTVFAMTLAVVASLVMQLF